MRGNGIAAYTAALRSPEALLMEHAQLVKRIAHYLVARLPQTVQLDDLYQAGIVGLLEASRKYDADKGASFETYAGIRIRGAMIDEVRRGDWTPRSVHRNARRVARAIHDVESEHAREATDVEIAEALGVSCDEYYAVVRDAVMVKLTSFDELADADDAGEMSIAGALPGPLEGLQSIDFKRRVTRAIAGLPEREQLVVSLYYDEEMNLKEIGEVIGVSESRVSQIHSQAMARLRSRMTDWSA